MKSKWTLAILGLCGMLLPLTASGAPGPQSAQSSQASASANSAAPINPLVAASRKAREQKAQQQGKTLKVYTNDDLGQLKTGGVSVVGAAPQAPAEKADKTAASKTPAAPSTDKGEAYWRGRFADARRTLTDDSKELDILQREYNLKEQQYYSDPNQALREQYDRKDLDDMQAKIDAKKADVDKDQQALEDLQDELRKAGGDPGWATDESPAPETPPAQPPSDAQPNQP